MAQLTGGCLCGRVRYTLTGAPALSCLCHCRLCQRYTGSDWSSAHPWLKADDARPHFAGIPPA
jgi:hypothetical protein